MLYWVRSQIATCDGAGAPKLAPNAWKRLRRKSVALDEEPFLGSAQGRPVELRLRIASFSAKPLEEVKPVAQEPNELEHARLTLEGMGTDGDTVAHLNGDVVNVFGGIPGEDVIARIVRYRRRRRHYTSGIVTEVLKPSPHRVAPPCPYFGPCSGCQWQHVDYRRQLTMKREAVVRQLAEYDGLSAVPVAETVPSAQEFGYRNHARFTIKRRGGVGFVNRITRRFLEIDKCMLMHQGINDILGKLQGRSGETSQLSVRYGTNTGEWLVQPKLDNGDITVESGQDHYRERMLGQLFQIASPSFFQVNIEQAERLVLLVRDRLELNGHEVIVDAYAGVGTFAVLLASSAGRVFAIEESDAALKDAVVNAAKADNVEFLKGRVEDVIGELESTPDAVILDPPRAGCHPAVLEAVARVRPRRTVYVSCDPGTMARDLQALTEQGMRVESVEPVDMFPQTHHVECVATIGVSPE